MPEAKQELDPPKGAVLDHDILCLKGGAKVYGGACAGSPHERVNLGWQGHIGRLFPYVVGEYVGVVHYKVLIVGVHYGPLACEDCQ